MIGLKIMSNTLLGGAVGDALGVPFESKPADNPLLLEWDQKTYLGSKYHNLLPGQFSDDTQFSMTLAKSLVDNNGFNPDDVSKKYVELFTSETIRGYGKTTLMAIQNLESGKHWSESGIAGSYGNGTAMRASPLGVYFRDDAKALINACTIDAQMTHASDEAIAGSIAIAMAAALACRNDLDKLCQRLCEWLPDSKVKESISGLDSLVDAKHIMPSSALSFLGTKADVKETVPAALYCFLKFNNYYDAVLAAIMAGKDTDTTAAIVGALFGSKLGMQGISQEFYSIEDFDKLVQLDSQLYNRSSESFFPRT